MNQNPTYDAAITGGGLAGLALAIQLARAGHSVVLFEKEKYPFHKVCGEYISLEAWNFLEELGLPLSDMDLPIIRRLMVSAPDGFVLKQRLPLGGFGISRYQLDHWLARMARNAGVTLLEECRVSNIQFNGDCFTTETTLGNFESKTAAGSFGKKANLDLKWERPFALRKPDKLNNFIGVKYHIQTDHPADTIVLHNFYNGYCGLSRVEDGKHCLCYLTTAGNLKASNNSIEKMEENILSRNPHLKRIFQTSTKLYTSPLTIAQVSFHKKSQVENHVICLGDAAGTIAPLCGNGMSMALHASLIAAGYIRRFLNDQLSREEMERGYQEKWTALFGGRLRTGRFIQRWFGKEWATNLFVRSLSPFPGLVSNLIRRTHGDTF